LSGIEKRKIMERKHEKYERLIARCKAMAPIPTAVAHPCDESSLRGAVEAAEMGILQPILVGPRDKIEAVAAEFHLDISKYEIVDAEHSNDSAAKAVQLAREGKAEMLMKGSLHTDELMGAVVRSATGLRTERRISHAFIMDVPSLDRVIIVTDAAINIFPTLEDKKHIVQNAIDLFTALGYPQPKVAILSAMETVNPDVPSTVEAAALCKMADRKQITGGCWMARWHSTTPLTLMPPESRRSIRRWRGWPISWWRPIWRPATCWPKASASWRMPMRPVSFSGLGCQSF
jgi:phosphate acetyltransferase